MGFKKTNYVVSDYGATLPEAYAVITELSIQGTLGCAVFSVQASRTASFDLQPYEQKVVYFDYTDRTQNPYDVAYLKAKGVGVDENGEQFNMPFHDWEDDIVE